MEAAKEDIISHYLPILDDISVQQNVFKEGVSSYATDLCILFIIYV